MADFQRINKSEPEKAKYRFAPKDDIKAYELAQITPILVANWTKNTLTQDQIADNLQYTFEDKELNKMAENLRRHFEAQQM